jgi:hypothetical protein
VPNRQTSAIEEKLAALNCDPIVAMATLAMDSTLEPALRARVCAELAQYVHPKRRAIESVIELHAQAVNLASAEEMTERLEAALRCRQVGEWDTAGTSPKAGGPR